MKPHLFAALALAGLAVACDSSSSSGGSPDTGFLSVEATDAFLSHTQVEEARIDLRAIKVNSGNGMETVYDGEIIEVFLTELVGGAVTDLAKAGMPDGVYYEVELEVAGGYLRLINGQEFSTEAGTLTLCSASETATISPVVTIAGSPGSTLLLDFDLTHSFTPMPAGSKMLSATSFELCPHVRAVELEGTGELRGTIAQNVNGQPVLVDDVNVIVLPGGEGPGNAITTTATTGGGTFAALGLEPGRYDILCESDDARGFVAGLTVVAGEVTTVDVTLE